AEKEKAIYTRAITSVEERLVAIRQEVIAGSKAEIDTLETYVLAENFRLYIREATLKVYKAKLALSAHLWLNDEQPLEIEENAKPDENSMFFIDSMLVNYSDKKWNEMLLLNHPELLELGFQKDIGNLEMKLKKQAILPDLKLKYQVLTPPGSTGTQAVYDNYKFGVNFNTSLFLRQERGAYLKSKYEFESISFKYTQKTREIQLKNRALWQQIETYTSNYTNFINITAGYEKLLTAEVLKTDAGESNLFIINTRQIRFLEAEVKLVQMWAKMQESKVDYLMQAGILYKSIPL
ncbi:MAG: TolC family protein, partial [Bacteroidia bacterium]|nr:TolC family protein [Bacteroidia bacterium]